MGKFRGPVAYACGSDKVGSVRVTNEVVPVFEGERIIKVPNDGQRRIVFTFLELEAFLGKYLEPAYAVSETMEAFKDIEPTIDLAPK